MNITNDTNGKSWGFCSNCIIRTNIKLENCFICGNKIIPFDPDKHSRSALQNKERYT